MAVLSTVKYKGLRRDPWMSCAIVIHGPIGSGKTSTCLKLADRARAGGVPVVGILSIRVYRQEVLVGYDCLDLASGSAFPLIRLGSLVQGWDWFRFGRLKYVFSAPGFERANCILKRSAEALSCSPIVFIDEFGRLEREKHGIHPGAAKVTEALREGSIVVFTCRTDLIEAVEDLVHGRAQNIFRYEPGDVEAAWRGIQRYVKHMALN